MSVIISILHVSEGINRVTELPDGFVLEPLGTHDEVLAVIKSLFPEADYSDPTWIRVYTEELSEIILGVEDPVYSFGFRNPSFQLIQRVYEITGWRGLNPSDGRFIPPFIPLERYGFASGDN